MNALIWLLLISTGLPERGALSSEKLPARIFKNHLFDMFDQLQHLLDTLHKSLWISV